MMLRKCDQCGRTWGDDTREYNGPRWALHRSNEFPPEGEFMAADFCGTACLLQYIAERIQRQ